MADPLYELLLPHLNDEIRGSTTTGEAPSPRDPTTRAYLERLSTLSLKSLATTEDTSITHASQSNTRSLQALSKRSHASITTASDHLKDLPELLTSINGEASSITEGIKTLESGTNDFAQKYERSTENQVLDRRRAAALLNRSFERIGNILELPSLLSSTVNASAALGAGGTSGSASTVATSGAALTGYASALDLHAHVKRLRALYPNSALVASVVQQSDEEISNMITVLVTTLQSPTLKLAVAMRTIGWLRHLTSTSDSHSRSISHGGEEGALGDMFLACRLITLRRLLEALQPLKQLADQESKNREANAVGDQQAKGIGAQSERYLKRYIEIFREQSFAIISMYKSIFPTALPVPDTTGREVPGSAEDGITPSKQSSTGSEHAPALAALVPELAGMLSQNLRDYMPNVVDRSARDSLLSQVLFCAGSLGRLGADFGMMLALLGDIGTDSSTASIGTQEWAEAMKKHRVQASRLEVLSSGVASGKKASVAPESQPQSPVVAAR
ncbi:hypothetical protein ANO11243_080060 [Dothideomycetidae sp. 11243]|nr:hypothetical protein ANO11243_080060 [fungal sp. No.11243]